MIKISAVILTLNEERNIERCIRSVQSIADEILVVDSFSTDATEDICKKLPVRFIKHKFEGYIEQKNWALDQAAHDIVLSLDADEALDEKAQSEVRTLKDAWDADGFILNRVTNYCGKWIRHGAWYPDRKLRIWDRRKGRWGGTNPHDKVEMAPGSVTRRLKGDILHYSFETTFVFFHQSERFSTIAANAMYRKGKKVSALTVIFKTVWKFNKDYIFKLGFLDGYEGFVIAVENAHATFSKYIKLRYLNKTNKTG